MATPELRRQIETLHAERYATSGSPRVDQEVKAQGITGSENRLARRMPQAGI